MKKTKRPLSLGASVTNGDRIYTVIRAFVRISSYVPTYVPNVPTCSDRNRPFDISLFPIFFFFLSFLPLSFSLPRSLRFSLHTLLFFTRQNTRISSSTPSHPTQLAHFDRYIAKRTHLRGVDSYTHSYTHLHTHTHTHTPLSLSLSNSFFLLSLTLQIHNDERVPMVNQWEK